MTGGRLEVDLAKLNDWRRLQGNVMVGNITFLMIFAVFDPSPLTLWINCSF